MVDAGKGIETVTVIIGPILFIAADPSVRPNTGTLELITKTDQSRCSDHDPIIGPGIIPFHHNDLFLDPGPISFF
jgi:hypothetical protein